MALGDVGGPFTERGSIVVWIWYILRDKDVATIRLIATGIWVIWKNRNLVVKQRGP